MPLLRRRSSQAAAPRFQRGAACLFSKQRAVRGWTETNHGGHGGHRVENEELEFVETSGRPLRFFVSV